MNKRTKIEQKSTMRVFQEAPNGIKNIVLELTPIFQVGNKTTEEAAGKWEREQKKT